MNTIYPFSYSIELLTVKLGKCAPNWKTYFPNAFLAIILWSLASILINYCCRSRGGQLIFISSSRHLVCNVAGVSVEQVIFLK
jgi:hypothetical protein